MPNPRLAARYAKSLVDLAIEKGELETIYNDMLFLQSVCKNSREFVGLLKSPVIKADKKDKVLDALTNGKISLITASFNKLLIAKGRENVLPEIIPAFIQQYKEYKGIYTVKLSTAVPVSDEAKSSIIERLKSSTPMKHIELNTEVNEKLIGGFVLEVAGQLVDASILYDLNTIKKQFQNNDFIYKIR
ncbi:MAG: ATP synthase F1 subunit delta [Bacteroidetes bacterium]|nr:ATP synthase F1 subunit delta [Bacteroidota bacterium]MBS1972830.1 ATP synthase F1 subunit delta [Bacteroidota bacterium]